MSSLTLQFLPGLQLSLDVEKPINVLHVDDDVCFLESAKEVFELKGFNVDIAASVEEALQKLEKSFDVVVSDYLMPGKDGLQFLKELRENRNSIPFVILTGEGMEEVAIQALNLGADHYVKKAANPQLMFEELAHYVTNAAENRRTHLKALLQHETLKAMFDSAPNAVMIVSSQGTILECNKETTRLLGTSKMGEILGKNFLDFVRNIDRSRVNKALEEAVKQGTIRSVPTVITTEYLTGRFGEVSASVLRSSSGNPLGLVVMISDVTEREKSENVFRQYSKRLEEHRGFLENIFAAIPDIVVVCDLKGNIIKCNQEINALHSGSPRKDFLGMNLYNLLEENHEMLSTELKNVVETGSIRSMECIIRGKGIDEFPAEISIAIVKDHSKKPMGFVCVIRNLSERNRLQEQCVVSEKMAAIGKLATSFSHDIRNPLAIIKNSVSFLELRLAEYPDEKVVNHLRILKQEINHSDSMVNDLLDFARWKPPNLEQADLNQLLESTLSSAPISENIRLSLSLGKIPKMSVDTEQLRRVFANLIMNAIQAMPNGGELKVETRKHQNSVTIAFLDTGVGISEKAMKHIFKPFFTTKPSGVGLGLNLSRQIVEAHNGEISVSSMEGRGSTFIVKLPILVSKRNSKEVNVQ